MATVPEPEILIGRRAFAKTQELFAAGGVTRLKSAVGVGWHDTATHPETGAFALIRDGAGLDDLLGEIVLVTRGSRAVYVYVIGGADVPTDLSLARRAFFSLGLLALDSITCSVEVVG